MAEKANPGGEGPRGPRDELEIRRVRDEMCHTRPKGPSGPPMEFGDQTSW